VGWARERHQFGFAQLQFWETVSKVPPALLPVALQHARQPGCHPAHVLTLSSQAPGRPVAASSRSPTLRIPRHGDPSQQIQSWG